MELTLCGVSVQAPNGQPLLMGVDLTLGAGDIVVVAGPSGSGKSTLLGAVAGLRKLAAGALVVDGQPIDPTRPNGRAALWPRLSWIGQSPGASLPPRWSLLRGVMDPLLVRGLAPQAAEDRARDALAQLGLAGYEARRPHEVSGGQAQRACVAMALAQDAELLLCDEPSSALDEALAAELARTLRDVAASRGVSALIASHDAAFIAALDADVRAIDGGRLLAADSADSWRSRHELAWRALMRPPEGR